MASVTHVALFHSVLGVRAGVYDAAARLEAAGHTVTVVDQYDGVAFDDYSEAGRHAAALGYPALMQRALEAVTELPSEAVYAGFSNGGGMAEFVAANRPGTLGVLMLSGALDPAQLGVQHWPAGVPAQIHYALDDPFRNDAGIDATRRVVEAAGGKVEAFLDYPGTGHLFTDPELPEYDPTATKLLWQRVLQFLGRVARDSANRFV